MFAKYYQSELSYLREVGREFAIANPALAGLFAERGGDPDIDRLLEGFAFLTGRIRERIDDAVPEIVEALAQLLIPQFLSTLPASAVIEFEPQAGALRGRHRVAAGTELGSRAMDGTSCLFRTTWDLDLLPIGLHSAAHDDSIESHPVIRMELRVPEFAPQAVFDRAGFRMFLHGPLALTSTLFLWFQRHLDEIVIRAKNQTFTLPKDSLRATAFLPEHAIFPSPRYAASGSRLLREYLTLPPAMLFLDLVGLDRITDAPSGNLELLFRFKKPPKLPERLPKDIFRLNCAPVVNLFEMSADPIPVDVRMQEYLLRANGVNPLHMEIHSVQSVTGLLAGRRGRREYSPFFSFAHAGLPREQQAYYAARRTRSPIDSGVDTYLSVMTPRDVAPDLSEETLSIELTCTNRSLPSQLRVGDICIATPRSPTIAKFKNITAVTKPVRPPFGSELHWRLVSHLALNLRSLGEPTHLRSLLALYNVHEEADAQLARTNERRIEGLREVEMRPIRRLLENVPVRGIQSTVSLDEGHFAGVGDAFLFGAVLDAVLADRVTINSFHELVVRLHPSGVELTWPARNGSQALL